MPSPSRRAEPGARDSEHDAWRDGLAAELRGDGPARTATAPAAPRQRIGADGGNTDDAEEFDSHADRSGGAAGGGPNGPNGDGPGDAAPPPRRRRRRRGRKILLISLLVFALLIGGGAVAGALYLRSVEGDVDRVDAFDEVPAESRPEKVEAAKGAMNFLVLGSDSRDPDNSSGSRTDTIILAHLPNDRSSAQVISIPRDTWVHVPKSPDGKNGNTDAKINAAFAWGGVPLMVQTVEAFTGVRIDHVVMVDFSGFQQIVDALGGVDIQVEQNFKSIHPPYRQFTQGMKKMDGATALDYARQRQQFADGDFARIRHQQQVIKAILDKASSGGLLTNPGRLNSFLRATADAVAVDNTLSIVDMAMDLRHLRSGNLGFYTSPSKGTDTIGDQSVVVSDEAKAKALFDAIRRDAVSEIPALVG